MFLREISVEILITCYTRIEHRSFTLFMVQRMDGSQAAQFQAHQPAMKLHSLMAWQ